MHYLLIVQNDKIATVFSYSSYDEALSAFHTEMAYRAEDRTSTKCMLINDEFFVLMSEKYVRNLENSEPQEV